MSRRLVSSGFALMFGVAACNTAGPHFRHLPATRITVEQSTFDVRVNRRLAEAIRVNARYAPRLGPVGLEAARAMHLVSGCAVTEVRGDAAQTTGVLDCGEGPPPVVLVAGLNYECVAIDGYFSSVDGSYAVDYDCAPVPY